LKKLITKFPWNEGDVSFRSAVTFRTNLLSTRMLRATGILC